MEQSIDFRGEFRKDRIAGVLILLYFVVSGIEIVAEFLKTDFLILCSKPLLMPLLIAFYWRRSERTDWIFAGALFFAWVANMLFISKNFSCIITGTLFFMAYRILIIYLVLKLVKLPGVFPLLVGSLPFLFIYLFVANLTYGELGDGFWLFAVQGFFTIVFGGLSLGNYIFKSNKSNTYLLISTMLFTFTQFLFVIRLYYISLNIFQPLAMLLFVAGQFMLCQFILLEEKKLLCVENINGIKEKRE
ncbi:MAG TPA: lysoplasmalogenase family protein [Flavobacterium sp.]|nr:lysoplasmalogenase family protein [Flavobacterium sp.]